MTIAAKPKLALFSPMPPQENGIADYSYELLPLLAQDFEVTVVLEDKHPPPLPLPPPANSQGPVQDPVRWLFLAEYLASRADYAGHIHLYHLGNNMDHAYLLQVALERPGLVVLHDVSLHHLMDCATLANGDLAGYTALLEREHGPAGQALGEQFERYRWRERAMFYELPLTRTLLARALGVVTHSAFAYFKAKAQSPDTPAFLIPHHLTPEAEQVDALDRTLVREKLGLEGVELVLLSLGFITKAKQIDAVFRFLAGARDQLPPFRYLLAGARLPEQFDVDAEITSYGLDDVVIVTDYLDEAAFFEHIAAADLVVNLRYPTGGETSGTLIRALGCGACVVVVDHGPFAELPDDVCVKVPWSARFAEDLEAALLESIHNVERRKAIGARAKRFIRGRHAIAASAAAYRAALLAIADQPVPAWGVSRPHGFPTPQTLAQRFAEAGLPPPGHLWVREAALPEADPQSRLALAGRGYAAQAAWLARYGYSPGQVDEWPADEDGPPFAPRAADAALYADAAPGLAALRAKLAALNRALALGGVLALDLIWSGSPDASANPRDIEDALVNAGFKLLKRALGGPTEVFPALDFGAADPWEDAPFEGCWQALKVSEFPVPRFVAEAPSGQAARYAQAAA